MNIRSRMSLHMDLHMGDDSPDPISKSAFDKAVEFAELLEAEINDLRKQLHQAKPLAEIVCTRDGNCRPCWNVLSKAYGNSGYLYSLKEAWDWAIARGYRIQ